MLLRGRRRRGPATRDADIQLFAVALRNLIRAVEFASKVGDPREAKAITAGLDRFKERVLHAVDIRDILEHFDEYERGTGKLQTVNGFSSLRWLDVREATRASEGA